MVVELELLGVDHRRGARELPELAQLRVGEGRLGGPAAPEQHDLLDLRGRERRQRVIGAVGDRELVGLEHQHARDVDRDVAVADDDRARGREVERLVVRVGVAVVPGHEARGGVGAGPVLARDAEPVVVGRADRVDDRVVALEQLARG